MVPEFAGLSDGGRGDADEVEEQRLKNNMAVKRSRMKSRQKMSQMVDRWVSVPPVLSVPCRAVPCPVRVGEAPCNFRARFELVVANSE